MPDDGIIVYGPARAFEAEGARCGVVTCSVCGAALLLDPATPFDVMEVHTEWHARVVTS